MYIQSRPLTTGSIVARTEIAGPGPIVLPYFKAVFSIFTLIPHSVKMISTLVRTCKILWVSKDFEKRKRLFQVDQPQ
jgi:hypothetical protein